jgi:hypothetical protein
VSDAPGATLVDLLRVRGDLQIGPTDPRQAFGSTNPADRRFAALFGIGFPLLEQPQQVPALDAIDLTRVAAVANNGLLAGRQLVVVLATAQPFAEIATKLRSAGYSGQGDVLTDKNLPPALAAASTVAGGQGVVAIGADATAVQAAANGTAAGIHGVPRDLIAALNAPAATVFVPGSGCIQAIGLADDVADDRGSLAVVTDSPQAGRLTAGQPRTTSHWRCWARHPPTTSTSAADRCARRTSARCSR